MACMEHLCVKCGEFVLDNNPKRAAPCHKCGSTRWISTWDEADECRERMREERMDREDK